MLFKALMIGGGMNRDRGDWQYFDDEWDKEEEKEEKKNASESSQKQCSVCLRWIDRESPYCVWCGRSQPVKE